MRIYNEDTDKKVNKIILYLTPNEAQELKDSLELIINNNEKHHHEHIPDRANDFKREITVCVYREDDLSTLDERSRRIIQHDE